MALQKLRRTKLMVMMRKLILMIIVCVVLVIAVKSADLPLEGVFNDGEVVLFIGDSITHGGRGDDMNHYLGHGYVAEIAMRYLGYRPRKGLCFLNRGVSGDTTYDLLKRWDADVVHLRLWENGWRGVFPEKDGDLQPNVVSILVGINDFQNGKLTPDEYTANLEQLVDRTFAVNAGCQIVICEPFSLPADMSPGFQAIQKSARSVAMRHRLCFVDFQRLFSDVLIKENPNAKYWFWDKAHPTYAAHIRMADWWLDEFKAFRIKGSAAVSAAACRKCR